MLLAIPEKKRFTQACSSRDKGLIPLFYFTHIQNFKVALFQNRNAIGISNQVIDHLHLFDGQRFLKRLNVYPPRKVRGDDDFLGDGSSHTKAGCSSALLASLEVSEDVLQSLVIFA